jgi:hypothetical protein
MVYPATWKALRVNIFPLTDRGQAFDAAACTTILLLVTLLALVLLARIRGRAALRRLLQQWITGQAEDAFGDGVAGDLRRTARYCHRPVAEISARQRGGMPDDGG